MRRTAIALVLISTALVFSASSAVAQEYGTASVSANNTSPDPGETITVSGTGCPPNAPVDFFLDGQADGSTTSAGDGSFSGQVGIPSNAASGTHTITVQCGAVVMGLEITVSPAAVESPVARTGTSSTIPLTTLGLALLAVGALIVVFGRRRRLAHTS